MDYMDDVGWGAGNMMGFWGGGIMMVAFWVFAHCFYCLGGA